MSSRLSSHLALVLMVLLAGFSCPPAIAQPVVSPPPARTDAVTQVTVDLSAGAFDRALPFGVPFFITGRTPAGTIGIEIQHALIPESGDTSSLAWAPGEPARWKPDGTEGTQTFLVLVRGPLEAKRHYRVRFTFVKERPAENTTVTADGWTPHGNYVSIDVGLLYSGPIGIGALYVGANVYLEPVNKSAPLGSFNAVGQRLALTVGATVSSITDDENHTRSGLFWNQAMVLGAGYRLTRSVRAGGGALVFRESDPNPLITSKTAAVTWYASISFDLDLLNGL
jgi:hypothetical protein